MWPRSHMSPGWAGIPTQAVWLHAHTHFTLTASQGTCGTWVVGSGVLSILGSQGRGHLDRRLFMECSREMNSRKDTEPRRKRIGQEWKAGERRRMGTRDQGEYLMQSAFNTRVNKVFRRENWIAISSQDRYRHVVMWRQKQSLHLH